MTNGKALVSSWTFWFGICQILTAIVGFFGGFSDAMTAYTLLATGLASIGLRLKTAQPITTITN